MRRAIATPKPTVFPPDSSQVAPGAPRLRGVGAQLVRRRRHCWPRSWPRSCASPPDGAHVEADRRSLRLPEPAPARRQPPYRDPEFRSAAGTRGRRGWRGLGHAFHRRAGGARQSPPPTCRGAFRVECRAQYRAVAGRDGTEPFGAQDLVACERRLPPRRPRRTFVGAAITGGGNKSAVYATEVLLELGRYGLADEIDVISSVSGGSFAALHYALTCDQGAPECASAKPGWTAAGVGLHDDATRSRWTRTTYGRFDRHPPAARTTSTPT